DQDKPESHCSASRAGTSHLFLSPHPASAESILRLCARPLSSSRHAARHRSCYQCRYLPRCESPALFRLSVIASQPACVCCANQSDAACRRTADSESAARCVSDYETSDRGG